MKGQFQGLPSVGASDNFIFYQKTKYGLTTVVFCRKTNRLLANVLLIELFDVVLQGLSEVFVFESRVS